MKYATTLQNKAALRATAIHDLRSSGIIVSQEALNNETNNDCIYNYQCSDKVVKVPFTQ